MNRDDNNNSSPQFTRRHYVFLASVMRDVYNNNKITNSIASMTTIRGAIKTFAEALANQNENFDQARFLNDVFCPNLIKTENN